MNIILWIVQVVLALLFFFAGVSKFIMPAEEMVKNTPPFLPIPFIYFIAVCEILGGLGLLLPWALKIKPGLTPLAAFLLMIIMIGAVVITVLGSPAMAVIPAVVGALCLFVAWGRRSGA